MSDDFNYFVERYEKYLGQILTKEPEMFNTIKFYLKSGSKKSNRQANIS
jgi:hypothetical protein